VLDRADAKLPFVQLGVGEVGHLRYFSEG
jgi:hypothetical protein